MEFVRKEGIIVARVGFARIFVISIWSEMKELYNFRRDVAEGNVSRELFYIFPHVEDRHGIV